MFLRVLYVVKMVDAVDFRLVKTILVVVYEFLKEEW